MTTELIDRIYECAVVPELWPDVLNELAAMTNARGGLMFSARKTLCWTASESIRDVFEEYVSDGWFAQCSRRVCLMNQKQPSFFVEQDFWSDAQIGENPIYRDFFYPRGLGWSAGTGVAVPTGDRIVFSIERAFDRGPVEPEHVDRLNALRPHLARSALVTARLSQQRARGMTEALSMLRLPAVLVDDTGRAIEASDALEGVSDHVRIGAHDRIVLTDARAKALLSAALQSLDTAPVSAPCTLPVRDGLGQAVLVLHVLPVRRTAHDVFGPSHALLMFTPVSSDRAPPVDLIRSMFDLTPSEARVASGLAAAMTLEEIAEAGGVAMTTVRSQMRRVLEKTGCKRQAEVAALLSGMTAPFGFQAD